MIIKERFMIVRILNILAQDKDDNSTITEPCYVIVDSNYETLESAHKIKETYRESQNYIIINYYI